MFGLRSRAAGLVEAAGIDCRSRTGGWLIIMLVRQGKAIRRATGAKASDEAIILEAGERLIQSPQSAASLAGQGHIAVSDAEALLATIAARAHVFKLMATAARNVFGTST